MLTILNLLKKINQLGTTVLIVTHDRELVTKFGGRIIELDKGRVVSDSGAVKIEKEEGNSKSEKTSQNKKTETTTTPAVSSVDEIVGNAVSEVGQEMLEEQQNNHESNLIMKNIIHQESTNNEDVNQEEQKEPDASKYDDLIQEIRAEQDKKS